MLCDFGKVGCPWGVARPRGGGSTAPGLTWARQRGGRRRMRGRRGAGSPFSPPPPFPGLGPGLFGLGTIISLENLPRPGREVLGCPRAGWQPNGPASIGSPGRALARRPFPAHPRPLAPIAGLCLPPPHPQFVCIVSEKERISELQLKTPSVSNESPIVFHNVFGRSLPANSFKP